MSDHRDILIVIVEGDSASGICAQNIAASLNKYDYKVDLLTCSEKINVNGVGSYHIKPKFAIRLQQYTENKGLHKLNKAARFFYKIQVAITALFFWPWNSPIFTVELLKKVRKLQIMYNYKYIIPFYTQVDPLIVGSIIKNIYPDIKYIPYFIDSLSGGPTPKVLTSKKKIKKGIKWENLLLKNADYIIAMKSSQKHHNIYSVNKVHFSKIKFFDIPMILEIPANKCEAVRNRRCPLKITYIGSMPLGIRNPYYGLEILGDSEEWEVRIVGEIPDSKEYVEFCKQRQNIKLLGRVPHEDVYNYVMESDILLNFGNNIREMVPSKIFEYISYGKPILSFSPTLDDPSIQYLQEYSAACLIYEKESKEININKIREFISKFVESIVPYEEIKNKYYLNTPECFSEFILSTDEERLKKC